MWRTGQRRPGVANRRRLLEAFGIPIEAWDDDAAAPGAPLPAVRAAVPADTGAQTSTSSEERLEQVVAECDRLLALAAEDPLTSLRDRLAILGEKSTAAARL